MSSPLGPPLLVANPGAGAGRDAVLPRLTAALRTRGLDFDVVTTGGPGDATRLARQAVQDGRRFVVAVGGDGTVQEVVNGLVDAETGEVRGRRPVLGVVAGGTGCDFARTFGLDRAPEVLADHLLGEQTLPIDLGRVRLTGLDGRPRTVLFANIAEAGYGGDVIALANRLPRRLGRARYGAAIVGAIARFRHVETTVTVDQGTRTEPLCNVVVANGQFFGRGLQVAPRALPYDDRFNVQSWGATPFDVLRAAPQLRKGDHLSRSDVREWQSARVEVAASRPLLVEADGEVLGRTPASFDLLHRVIDLKL
ncbi:diacylglycerol/lipid kinase family protein [Egicoccus halophilus]|uniref:Lipid kinase n=1 Tax=Egicoccus halophilus TaxID=1670830 RepID=A0A8J3A6N6_9ACTN|nr:YegS/Rv2252/BmrU family lipid kinase [Egicoccus halophilus]GGI04701.1 lipid kinase [Egicoccus halophilus]